MKVGCDSPMARNHRDADAGRVGHGAKGLKGYLHAHLKARYLGLLGFPPDPVHTASPCGR